MNSDEELRRAIANISSAVQELRRIEQRITESAQKLVLELDPAYGGIGVHLREALNRNAAESTQQPEVEPDLPYGAIRVQLREALRQKAAEDAATRCLSGSVVDAAFRPLPFARIAVDTGETALAGENGRFTLPVSPDARTFTASLKGYVHRTVTFGAAADPGAGLTVVLNELLEGFVWPRVLRGRVVDENGEPLPGGTVRADNGADALADPDGYFAMRYPYDAHFVTAYFYGFNDQTMSLSAIPPGLDFLTIVRRRNVAPGPLAADLCMPGDTKRAPWVIWFDDADREPILYTDEAKARKAFEQFSVGYNCYLFRVAERGGNE